MLELDRITAQAGNFTLSADWAAGPGRYAVIGPSGAGKSTFLDLVAGFRRPVSGRLRILGEDVTDQPPARRPVSILFQDNNLFPHLSVAENLALALKPRGGRLSGADRDRIAGALARTGLAGLEERKPAMLSGGQQSRAALARILLMDRPILLLDEPFAALGPALKSEMLALVREVSDGTRGMVLLVTHDPDDARAFARETILVADGRVAAPASTAGLLDDPPPALRAYLGARRPGVTPV